MIPVMVFILIAAIIYEGYYMKKTYHEAIDFWHYLGFKTKHKGGKKKI
jgi:hypothetical protein